MSEPIDKETLPHFYVSSKHCLMVAALALTPTFVGIAIAEGDINLRSVASWMDKDAQPEQPETFCQNVAKQGDDTLAKALGRTFCGQEP